MSKLRTNTDGSGPGEVFVQDRVPEFSPESNVRKMKKNCKSMAGQGKFVIMDFAVRVRKKDRKRQP